MKALHLISTMIFASIAFSQADPAVNIALPAPLRYKLDGDFSDWKKYAKGWLEESYGFEGLSKFPRQQGVAFKGFYYDNDQTYLYLFYKCTPTPQKEIDRYHAEKGASNFTSAPFSLASIWIDTDMNKSTGSILNTKKDKSDTSNARLIGYSPRTDVGSEVYLKLSCGMFYSLDKGEELYGHFIGYSINWWDFEKNEFKDKAQEYLSYEGLPLINHGKHGIEMAILLSDLKLKKGQSITLSLLEDVHEPKYMRRRVIKIK